MSTPRCTTSCFVDFAAVILHLDLYLDHIKSCYDHRPKKQENIFCCLAKQVITKQCGSKCKDLNIVVTRFTSAAIAPVSFPDITVETEASRCRIGGPTHEDLLPLLQQVALSILPSEGLCSYQRCVCLIRDSTQQPGLECVFRLFSRQLE